MLSSMAAVFRWRSVACTTAAALAVTWALAANSQRPASRGGVALPAALGLDDACLLPDAGGGTGAGDATSGSAACALEAVQTKVWARQPQRSAELAAMAVRLAPQSANYGKQGLAAKLLTPEEPKECSPMILAARYLARGHTRPHRHVGWATVVPRQPTDSINYTAGWRASQVRWAASGEEPVPSWMGIPTIILPDSQGHERASIVTPILGGGLLILFLFLLCACRTGFLASRGKLVEMDEVLPAIAALHNTEADDVPTEAMSMPDIRLPQCEVEDTGPQTPISSGPAAEEVSSTASTQADAEVGSLPAATDGGEKEQAVPFFALFRYATPKDTVLIIFASLCSCLHGCVMPLSFYFVEEVFTALYLPNDDGNYPPTPGQHDQRDAQVRHVVKIYLCISITVLIARFCAIFAMARAAEHQVMAARKDLFRKILCQGPAWHDLHNSSELTSRVSMDTWSFREGLSDKLVEVIRATAITIACLSLAFYKDWKLCMVMCVGMPVCAFSMTIAIKAVREIGEVQVQMYSKAGGIAQSCLEMIRTVTAYGGHKRELVKYEAELRSAERTGILISIIQGFCFGVNGSVLSLALSLGMYAGSIWVLEAYELECWNSDPPFGTCRTGGTMMATMYCVMWGFTIGLGTMTASTEAISKARVAAFRIYEIVDEPPFLSADGMETLARVEGVVTFMNVRFTYPSRQSAAVLSGISVRIPAGSTSAFVGPSGSGKSTMISLLLRFYDPQAGTIQLDGRDIRLLNLSWLRSKMALVEQEPLLFAGSIRDNIACGTDGLGKKADVEHAATLANAHSFISQFADGYQTLVGENGAQMSGGQKQRIAIARALQRNPAILLLDEATSALDTESELVVQEALDKLLQNTCRTTLVIAHRLSTVRNADQICVMQDGRLVEQGTHEQLVSDDSSVYAQLARLQATAAAEDSPISRQVSEENEFKVAAVKNSPVHGVLKPTPRPATPLALKADAPAQHLLAASPDRPDQKDVQDSLIRRVWGMAKEDYWFYVLGLFGIFISAMCMPMYFVMIGHTVNLFNQPPVKLDKGQRAWVTDFDEHDISRSVSALTLFQQLSSVAVLFSTMLQTYAFSAAGNALIRRIRVQCFRAMLRQEIGWFDMLSSGTLTAQLAADIPQLTNLVGNSLASGAQAGLAVTIGFGLALVFSWRFTLCIIGVTPLVAIGALVIILQATNNNANQTGGLMAEATRNIRTVAAFHLEDSILQKLVTIINVQRRDDICKSVCFGLGTGTGAAGMSLILGLAVFFANLFVGKGLMSPSRVVMVLAALMSGTMGLAETSRWLGEVEKARDAVARIFGVLDRVSAIDALQEDGYEPMSCSGKVEFEEVRFRYPSRPEIPVFDGFSLVIEPKTTVALVGQSGSGKSTVVSLLQRFYDPEEGAVRLGGYDLRTLKPAWVRAQMGLVQQEPMLFHTSILENIRYGYEGASDEAVVAAATVAHAHSFVNELPEGYYTTAGTRGSRLSGGQRQRVAIARALIRDPAVLLLDEATSALDAQSEKQVQAALDGLLKVSSRTTIIIAHRLSTIKDADTICIVSQGKVVEKGKHEELLKVKDGHYVKLIRAPKP